MSIERQIELEEESVIRGYLRYQDRRQTHVEHQNEDQCIPSQALMRRTVKTVSEAIELDRTAKRRGRGRLALVLVESLESEALAWHGMRMLMSTITTGSTYAAACIKVGKCLRDELNYRRFKDDNSRSYKMTQSHLAQAPSGAKKSGIMNRMFQLSEVSCAKWSTEDLARVGAYVLDIVLRVTQWADVRLVSKVRGKKIKVINPRDDVLQWLDEANDQLALLAPVRMPMLVPPKPWVSPTEGGYLSDLGGLVTVIKSNNQGYLDALEQVDMPEVYAALNVIQEVPWRINLGIMDAARELWNEGTTIGAKGKESLPARKPLDTPSIPAQWERKVAQWKAEDFKGYKLWAQRAAVIHDFNRRQLSKRVSCRMKLDMALKFHEEPEIYFPHQLDFRGRIYPVSAYLSPQGDDLSKSLIQFAEGKALGEDGVYWLKVHAANCFGADKVSFEDRVRWADSHMDAILESAVDPVGGDRYWTTADDPFQALAACFELLGVSLDGDQYVSHLPISLDGSCNGLQNFSALLRDPVGGKATNLVPADGPSDIYQEVADLVGRRVKQDAESNHEWALRFDGYISRSLVKQLVMTLPYGATLSGMRQQIEDAVKKMANPMALATNETWPACGYIAEVTRQAISEVVVAATDAMDWLQKVARAAASEDYPIRWTTPVGLPVLQEYRVPESQQLRVHINGQKVKLHINHYGRKLDRRRQATGISPNLIHSLDAAHMMKSTLLAEENGVTAFAMVHDSFGCHACDVPVLHASIRRAFVDQYKGNLLAQFKQEVEEQLPEGIVLPDLPPAGTLDLAVVEDSWYFFA